MRRSVLQIPLQVFPHALTARTRVPGSLAGEVEHGLTIFTPAQRQKITTVLSSVLITFIQSLVNLSPSVLVTEPFEDDEDQVLGHF